MSKSDTNGSSPTVVALAQSDPMAGQARALSGAVVAARAGWVSVNDRLPEPNTRVLGFDGANIEFCQFGEYSSSRGHAYSWAAENYGPDGSEGKFDCTHWMPVPAAPANE